ncbi:MAG: hypothetical protein JWO97_1679, partial [Acidobacteria bacterium]|nr:hypothetical protein [Acidobacteriota bacterium]
DHNIALGYSKSSTSIKPGIYITGRLGTDTVNAMGAETTMQAGGGSQTGAYNRWGDYSSMTLDPIDQCTFWYTNEYLKTDGGFNWSTRIATYKFPSCTPSSPWGRVSGTITSCATGAPISGITVSLSNGFAGISDAAGNYSIQVPAGTYTATATGLNRNCTTSSPATVSVIATSGATTTQTFCMTGTSNLETTGTTIDDASVGNSNGMVNRNECVRLNVALKNTGCSNESAISTTLSTTTAGVTITQASAAYPDLAVDASGTNVTPFKFQTSSSFVCGTVISFTLTTWYASGSGSLSFSIPSCSGNTNQPIPSSSLTAADLTQSDRIFRDGVPSNCAGKVSPGGGFQGTKYYKAFPFTNNNGVAACYTVNLTAALGGATDIESVAYSSTYNPSAINTNYLGDGGSSIGGSTDSLSYSFTVPALTDFVVVVNTVDTAPSSVFSGTVSGFLDTAAGPGACPACVPPATPTVNPGGPTTFCQGASVTLTSSSATGNQWYKGPVLLAGQTGQNYVATTSGSYTVVVTASGCPSAPSSATNVVVNTIPATPSITPGGSTTLCGGASVTLTSSGTSGNQWYLNGNPIGGATNQQYVANADGNYTVVVTTSGCSSAASAPIPVTASAIPSTPTITPGGPTTFCGGASVTLTSSSATGNQWYLSGNPIGGATGQQYVANASGNYTVVVTTSGCSSAASAATAVTVNPTPAKPVITPAGPTGACTGGSVTLTSSSANGNQWYEGGNPIGGATAQQYVANASGNYSVIVTTNGCSSPVSATTVVTISGVPATPAITAGGPTTFCNLNSVTLTSSAAAGNQWLLDGNPIGGATAQQYAAKVSGNYTVVVNPFACSSAPSNAIAVTVNLCYLATSDLNGNIMSDIVLQNTNTNSVAAWLMEDNSLVDGKVVFSPTAETKIVATGDLDGDIRADIIVKNNTTGAISMWKMNGNVLVSQTVIATPNIAQRVVATYDFNHDGKKDIVLQNTSTGAVSLWLMNGATLTTGIALGNPGLNVKAVGAGKFGGDAILFQDSNSGAISRWTISSNVVASNLPIGTPAAGTNVVATADFDGDSNCDIALQQTNTRTVSVWLIGADGTTITQSAVVATPLFDWKVVGAADYNGNGRGDLLLHNPATNGIAQWQMNGVVIERGWNISTVAGWVPLGR